ncbi:M48 family metallopeptidase [Sphingomonas hengshuiensis]|uniref:Peptidase M48 domain-containing protein n=1 Tax=Sphingomonas hengshuiensis TaxID=1609977 RepID=A0A7U4LFD5_9SPHN|nr:M48 family metallopeptidase [Sphingomonas hengshuiensis]AJP72320.1 hypothetical protein TS85_11785 [Sphingomonas hengshuiensis]
MSRVRRAIAAAALAACGAGQTGLASAQDAVVPARQTPQSADERGLWMQMDEAERTLKTSPFVVRDPAINAYVMGVLCREVGEERCGLARLYIVRTPYFNASMAPNGMMQVWTGALLRLQDEAQLAAVLGHEFAHFERRHSLQNFRSLRKKTDAMVWLSMLGPIGQVASLGMLGSIFAFSRDMEREADVASLEFMQRGGYAPIAAASVWRQVVAEGDATAAARHQKKRRNPGGGFLDTHPSSEDRLTYLADLARKMPAIPAGGGELGAERYRDALDAWWPALIDDQIKLNDFGGTEFLLAELADGNWTGPLLYARGELYRVRGTAKDLEQATAFYRAARESGYAAPELHRGLGLALLRSGAGPEGQGELRAYLKARPDAVDKAMIAMMAGGQ